jgi:hypothetical protein
LRSGSETGEQVEARIAAYGCSTTHRSTPSSTCARVQCYFVFKEGSGTDDGSGLSPPRPPPGRRVLTAETVS